MFKLCDLFSVSLSCVVYLCVIRRRFDVHQYLCIVLFSVVLCCHEVVLFSVGLCSHEIAMLFSGQTRVAKSRTSSVISHGPLLYYSVYNIVLFFLCK